MKKYFLPIIFLLAFLNSYSQKFIENSYDYNWRPTSADQARFYSLSQKKDSGWYTRIMYVNIEKLEMVGLYEDMENTIRNGQFYWLYPNGKFERCGKYIHNKKEGLWLDFYNDGSLKDSSFYINGNQSGISISWYRDGTYKDSLNMDEQGNGTFVSWLTNGQPSAVGKYIDYNKQNGKWQYFHNNGKLSSIELYDKGSLKDKQYFDENGNPTDTTNNDRAVQFTGGSKKWNNYISSSVHFPNLQFSNGYLAVVVVEGTINEEGKVIDAEVTVPVHPDFDKAVLQPVLNSPSWQPCIEHNRKVCSTFRESVSFEQGFR